MLNKFFLHRKRIYTFLSFTIFFSYLISFAICSISSFLLLALFLIDEKKSLKNKLNEAKRNKLVKVYICFFLIQCIGLFYTTNIEFGIKRVVVMLPILFLPLVTITEKLDLKLFERLLGGFVFWIIALLTIFLLIHVYIDGRQVSTFVLYYLNDKLGISQFYISFIIIIPLLKLIKDFESKNGSFIVVISKSSVLLFFALLLGNITTFTFLSLLIIFKTLLFFKGKMSFFKIIFSFFALALVGLAVFFTPKINEKFIVLLKTTDFNYEIIKTKHSVTFANNTLEQRILLNACSLKVIKESFPFGVGTGDFMDTLMEEYKKINFKVAIKQGFNNHNQYLSEFTKTGIFGGGFFIIVIFLLLRKISFSSEYYTYLVILFAIGCMVESYLYRQHGVLIFSFFIPLFYSYERQRLDRFTKEQS